MCGNENAVSYSYFFPHVVYNSWDTQVGLPSTWPLRQLVGLSAPNSVWMNEFNPWKDYILVHSCFYNEIPQTG